MDVSSASETGPAELLSYRQRLEKAAGGDIVLMEWSPTIDLLAATLADDSVIVNRLSWQRVWTINAQANSKPTALAWRPDGKVLGVGRSDGSVTLIGVEKGDTLHTHTFTRSISSLHWMVQDESSIECDRVQYKDRSTSFLPPLPSLESSDLVDSAVNSSNLKQIEPLKKELDVLLAGDEGGVVHVCVGGVLTATEIDTADDRESHVIITRLSGDLRLLSAVNLATNQQKSTLHLQTVDVGLIRTQHQVLRHLALHFSHMSSLLRYATETLHCMEEAWEDLLLVVDAKLAEYSKTLKGGRTVADELLVLLACGRARSELRDFLLDDLTAKGVKKIGLSLEMSYTRVRKYCLTCLSSVIQALQFQLGEVLGLARWRERFGDLGISTDKLEICLKSLGTFALKNQELQLVIDESLQSMKAFFTWIYVVILKLGEEPVPTNMKEHLNPEELQSVIDFLRKRLAKSATGGAQTFNLEIVGQYLEDEDLKITEKKPQSFWERLLQESQLDSSAIPWFCSPSCNKSLKQLLNSLIEDIAAAFATTKEAICRTFVAKPRLPLLQSNGDREMSNLKSKVGELVCEGKRCVYFPSSSRDIVLLVYSSNGNKEMDCCRVCVKEVPGLSDQEMSEEPLNLRSVKVYNNETLSVLFEYKSSERDDVFFSAVAQLPVKPVLNLATDPFDKQDSSETTHDVGSLLTQVHSLGPFRATSMAVSGSRHLAAVFSNTTKKVRLFDVDAEEEEDEG